MQKLIQLIPAQPSQDGHGVKIHRLTGQHLHQTITYMKAGRMRHRDYMGNEGGICAGDVQWMTAGAGVLHSEMPAQEQGLMHGFQIWRRIGARGRWQGNH
jgi:redox-sensitive bicupin YhaK (pirin superfamily)